MGSEGSNFQTFLPEEHYKEVLKQDKRPDGRELGEFRQITVNVGSIGTANGSALVQMGNTMVVCGIKAELTKPPASDPERGLIVPNVELSAMCASHFRPGPPSDQAQVASKLLHDVITSCDVINLEKLCVCKDKVVWVLYCDLVCLNYDGNIHDSCIIALMAALENTKLPEIKYDEDNDVIETISDKTQQIKLNIRKKLVSSTFVQFQSSHVIADPTSKEEEITSTTMTVVTSESGDVCHLHHPGGFTVRDKLLQKCINRSIENGKKLFLILKELENSSDKNE